MNTEEIEQAYAAAEQAIAVLADLPLPRMTAHELLDARARHERLLRLVTAADREPLARLAELGTADFGGGTLKAILADRLRITPTAAGHRLQEAAELASRTMPTGESAPPLLPVAAEAERRGDIGTGHIKEIREFFHHLPDAVGDQARADAERDLVRYSEYLRPDQVKKCGERLAALLNPDGEFSDQDRARKRHFTMKPQGLDKMRSGTFCADPELAAYLESLFAKLAAPGMCHPDDARPVIDGVPDREDAARDRRTPGQRRHDALAALCRDALSSGRMGSHRGLPVTVIATATVQELQEHAGLANTGGGSLLPMRDLIRMASHSLPYLCVFDEHAERPLYFGRAKRLAGPDQRLALHATDRGCTHPGCPAPGYICETHHIHEWADGGSTDIDNLTFTCPTHHRLIGTDNRRWRTTTSRRGRTQWIAPHHVDPAATPRINSYHHGAEQMGAEQTGGEQTGREPAVGVHAPNTDQPP